MRLATNNVDGNGVRPRFGGARAAALRGGVSLIALLVAGVPGEARNQYSTGAVSPAQAALVAQQAAAQQAAAAATQAQVSLGRAAAALTAMRRAQQEAAAAAGAGNIPNGITPGGLMPQNPMGQTQQSCGTSCTVTSWQIDPASWIGVNGPVETVKGSQATVDITQTQTNAILNWQTFNVGRNTTLNFKQGGSDWTALNRVTDPQAQPSQILGQINATGGVYVINRNGIIFGAGSQVNVHALVASTLDVGKIGLDQSQRDQYFLTTGIAGIPGGKNSFSIFDADPVTGGVTTLTTGGSIIVKPGASITTNIVDPDSPGFVYLFGANVTNAGTITVPAGEVALVAARTVDLVPNGYSVLPSTVLGQDDSGKTLPMRGTEFVISPFSATFASDGSPSGGYRPGTGAVTHEGLIETPRGIVVMNGDTVTIGGLRADGAVAGNVLSDAAGNPLRGVISADTSISRNSMVLLRAVTAVDMNGVISSLPYDDGTTLKGGQAFVPAYIEMTAQSSVTLEAAAVVSAPSAYVALRAIDLGSNSASNLYQIANGTFFINNSNITSNAPGSEQVLLNPGATIDVAGLQNVVLPADYNFVSFQPRAEFADMPLQRNGALYGKTLWIDIRATGTRSDGTTWVGTPLADASGYVNGVGRGIDQLMTAGGNVNLTTDFSTTGPAKVQTAGSVINMAGGSVNFLPGWVKATPLLGIDGRIYSMAKADPNMIYVGVAGEFIADHARWNVTETWSWLGRDYSPGYSEGRSAGGISINTVTPLIQGTMLFGSVAGERQINAGNLPFQGSLSLTTPASVVIGTSGSSFFSQNPSTTAILSDETLSGYGLSSIQIISSDLVVSRDSTVNLAPGGKFSATASGAIDIAGNVSAAGGAISLTTDRFGSVFKNTFPRLPVDAGGNVIAANIYVEGVLDVSGRFVNDTGRNGTDAAGPAFTDGGTIALTTNKSSGTTLQDTTGSIRLAAGSVLDASSGGYISRQGKPKTTSAGVMAGKAGSISLMLYQGADWIPPSSSDLGTRPTSGPTAAIALDGTLRAYGFESNGSLTLGSADTIRIGGNLQPGEASSISIGGVATTLPVGLLNGGGFGSYTLQSIPDGWSGATANIVVSAGTAITLKQQNLSSAFDYSATGTGTRIAQNPSALAVLPDGQRQAVNLTLSADNIVLDTGSQIVTDPRARLGFGAVNSTGNLPSSDPTRNTPAKNVKLLGSIVDHGGTVFVNALSTYLGPQASVDLSGIFLAKSGFGQFGTTTTSGTLLAGGNFAVEAGAVTPTNVGSSTNYAYSAPATASYLVADPGAVVNVSGFAGPIEFSGVRGASSSVWSWSNAGTVSADVAGFAWGGSFLATGGRYVGTDGAAYADSRASNGTIMLGGGTVRLRQDTTDVISALAGFHGPTPQSPTALLVAADQLAVFDNVYLYAGGATGGASRIFNDVPGNIFGLPTLNLGTLVISGPLNWTVANRLEVAAKEINAPNPVNAQISGAYVLLTGGGGKDGTASGGGSSLSVTGRTIDVEGATFTGIGKVALKASGDLRLSTPKVVDGVDPTNTGTPNPADKSQFTGWLDAGGDLLLSAQRTYPVSAVSFTIRTPGNVTFEAPAGSNTDIPLAAGGNLTVLASTIDQNGNLFAPLGQIRLGSHDTTISTIITSRVTLGAGSLTSVTLADTTVPYGAIQDGKAWYYNATIDPLVQPPSKGLTLDGATVDVGGTATIDIRGGGDLQAMEWIPGQGGSRDTLASRPATSTYKGQTVYALVPTANDPVAAFDIHFNTQRSAGTPGDVYPLAGTQVTLDGGNGIPAGTYTLYPAHYATLPGALRVVEYGDNLGHNFPSGTTLQDGTAVVAGRYTLSTMPGKQSSGQTLFAVQTGDVWKQYSEYSLTGANSYFTQLAAKQGNVVPRLPMDAGRLAVVAQQQLILQGTMLTQPAHDGNGRLLALDSSGNFVDPQSASAFRVALGSELDIASPNNVEVVGHAQYGANDILSGYLGVDVSQLNGFSSVLIGGQRTDVFDPVTRIYKGTLITAVSNNVLVDVRNEVFSTPELLLVATAKSGTSQTVAQTPDPQNSQPGGANAVVDVNISPATGGTVTIASGTVIATTGATGTGSARNYYFADPNRVVPKTAQQIATALGGTLDSTGTRITGADLSKLDYHVTNPDGSITHHVGTIPADDLLGLQSYSYGSSASQPGLGALFVATNDYKLSVSGPAGISAPLTISFASSPGGPNAPILTLPDVGRVVINPGASITTGVLSLQGTATTNAIVVNTSNLRVGQLNLTGRTIGIGASAPVNDKSVAVYNGQFGDVNQLVLKALSGTITVYGDYNPGHAVQQLTLDAATVVRDAASGSASISLSGGADSKGRITLLNSGIATPATSGPAPGGTLELHADEIDLNGGNQTIAGYSKVNWFGRDRIFIGGPGALTLGTGTDIVDLTVTTPTVLVGTATSSGTGSFLLSTLGTAKIGRELGDPAVLGRAEDSSEIGGNLTIKATSIAVGFTDALNAYHQGSVIQAQAGQLTLQATTGDVTLGPGANIAAGGYKKTLIDVDTFVPGGKVVLQADAGNVVTNIESRIDVAQPDGGLGYGGEIDVIALNGGASLAGALLGGGGGGLGGSFKLDIKNAADLTTLADQLLVGGVNGAIDIHTRTGNLVLAANHTLKANSVTLTADDSTWVSGDPNQQLGQVAIDGRIDARGYDGMSLNGLGQAGGQVSIYGANAVILSGTSVIDASTTHPDERGGDVVIGIGWNAARKILLQTGMEIDVSGGTKGGLSGGTVTFRAPRDGNNDVKIAAIDGNGNELTKLDPANIHLRGVRALTVEGYLAFDTTASNKGIDGSTLGWDGIIDPSGWYTSTGTVVTSGTWTDVSGWTFDPSKIAAANNSFTGVPTLTIGGGGGSGAAGVAVMGLNVSATTRFSATNQPPNQSNIPIVFAAPPGGVAATGIGSTDANGNLTVTIVNPGRGYTSSASVQATVGYQSGSQSIGLGGGRLQVVGVQFTNVGNKAYDGTGVPTVTMIGVAVGGSVSQFALVQGSSFTGTTVNNQFTPGTTNYIPWKSSGVYATSFDPANPGTASFLGDPSQSAHGSFFSGALAQGSIVPGVLVQATQGTWTYNGSSYGFANLYTRLQPLIDGLGSDVVHVRPGIELLNSKGDITVKANWNLASGTAGNLQGGLFTANSYVNFNYRLATPWGGLDAGALTLRAAGNVNVNASISDGFFQFANYLDPTYVTAVNAYLGGNKRSFDSSGAFAYYLNTYSGTVPSAPYKPGANGISPTSQDMWAADLFPNQLRVCTLDCSTPNIKTVTPSSWAISLTAGADLASANPNATLYASQQAGKGDVILNNHTSYSQTLFNDSNNTNFTSVTINLSTMVRTGTGNIDIAAAHNVTMADTVAPGVIYAAGVNTAKLADPLYNGTTSVVAGNPDGFYEPRVLAYGNGGSTLSATGAGPYYGPPTAAAFPYQGGDVTIDAQNDIIGYNSSGNKTPQYYQPWLLSDAGIAAPNSAAGAAASLFGAGVFRPVGSAIASQTAWWIQYGSFQQGFLSAGGNVLIDAGHNLVDVSVSLPTTGRVSGGLSANSVPVTHLNGSGNMIVRAGKDILGGSFYEGSGHASIVARGSVGQNGTVSRFSLSQLKLPDVPLLAVDLGQIEMLAGGSIMMAGVVNPAALHAQNPSAANPLEIVGGILASPIYMDTYGPDSKVRLVAATKDIKISIAPTAYNDGSAGIATKTLLALPSLYPASFEALALNGSITTAGISQAAGLISTSVPMPGIVLSSSLHGTFDLLAQGNIDLTFGYKPKTLLDTSPRPFFSAGPALLDTAFDPFQPNNGFDGAVTGAQLAHEDDQFDATARIYAVSGDITGTGTYGARTTGDDNLIKNSKSNDPYIASLQKTYQRMEINRPAKIYAGHDIIDLNVIIQNIHSNDVSTIQAGRNITYTGYNNAGGLHVAGAGFLVVQAGGDIGPFLPTAQDLANQVSVQEGIISVGNASPTPVGGFYVRGSGGSVGLYDTALYGPITNPRRNAKLTTAAGTSRNADIIVMFGAKWGADYQAVIDRYINPASAADVGHDYLVDLKRFLDTAGIPTTDPQDAWNKFSNASNAPTPPVSKDLQQVFVDQVFFAELKTVALKQKDDGTGQNQPGYRMINTMFPSTLGYTANALDGGTAGASLLVKTGDLNLLHGTIQSRLGGNISIFGPGGSILVGSLAPEPNPKLKLRDIGILSLGGGGIDTFSDGSALVNSSRVLTTQGGDILMWSSNGDLDAGRGSKTTISQPPIQVQFDANDYQTIDLGGFVSGAGVKTFQASPSAPKANTYLLAPRGKIDAGSAGFGSSGDLFIVAPVVVNASNIQAGGTVTGVPTVAAPPVGALTSGSNTAGAATRSTEVPTASGNGNRASVIMVEVVGYGGGDGQSVTPGAGPAPGSAPSADAATPASGSTPAAASAPSEPTRAGRSSNSQEDEKSKQR